MELQKKLYASVIKQPTNEAAREITFVVSDESPDRDGDVIEASGWDFTDFMRNALFMGFHDYEDFSYGKFTRIEKDLRSNPRRVLGTVKFPTIQELCPSGEVSEHAKNVDMMYHMYKNGYLNAVSVGCIYKAAEPRKDYPEGTPDYARGRRVTQASLLEVSAVPIPANANALVLMSADNAMDKKLVEYVTKSFHESEKPKEEPAKPEEKAIEPAEEKPEEKPEDKSVVPEVQKEGRRLSAATLSMVEELKAGLIEFDEAIESLKGCRGKMEQRIAKLETGSSEEPDEEDSGNEEPEKAVIHFVE